MSYLTLYIVDDYLLTRVAHRKIFENDKNFKVIGDFSFAESCLEKMKFRQADIILMDIELPGINGIEATKIISREYPKTKVIILTSFEDEKRILAALASGASGYIVKGKGINHLKKNVKMVASGSFQMDLEIAHAVFSQIQSPDSKDLNNLYKDENLKSILTKREMEVLKLIVDGKTNSQIAQEMIVSTNTAKAHVGSILTKLCAKDRTQAAVKAIRANLL